MFFSAISDQHLRQMGSFFPL